MPRPQAKLIQRVQSQRFEAELEEGFENDGKARRHEKVNLAGTMK
jgi:hypothetical protein